MESKPEILLTEPSSFSDELCNHLIPYAQTREVKKSSRLPLIVNNIPQCYILLEGSVAIHRSNDGLVVVNLSAPLVMGLNSFAHDIIYINTLCDCQFGILPQDDALALINEHNLWKLLANYLMVLSSKLWMTNDKLTAKSSYDLIKNQLFELMNESDSLRENVSAENYIQTKTHLSRSGIMRILSDLKKGKYIEIVNGRLTKINKLPSKY